jgi:hypothetical protein
MHTRLIVEHEIFKTQGKKLNEEVKLLKIHI